MPVVMTATPERYRMFASAWKAARGSLDANVSGFAIQTPSRIRARPPRMAPTILIAAPDTMRPFLAPCEGPDIGSDGIIGIRRSSMASLIVFWRDCREGGGPRGPASTMGPAGFE